MKKKYVKILAGILIVLMVLAVLAPVFLSASAKSVDSLQDELDQIVKEKKALENKMSKNNKSKSTIRQKKEQYDELVYLKDREVTVFEKKLNALKAERIGLESQKKEKDNEFSSQKEQFQKRIRAAYEQGPITYLDAIMQSRDISEMLSRIDIISGIMEYDRKLCAEIKDIQKDLSERISKIKENEQAQQKYFNELKNAKEYLKDVQEKNANLLSDLEKDAKQYKIEYNRIEKEENKIQKEIQDALRDSGGDFVGGKFKWPTPGYTRITSPFGMRWHPILQEYRMHTGVDIAAPGNSQVLAANSGKIIKSTTSEALGNYIVIDHGGGYGSLYAHLNKRYVSVNNTVAKGQKIGLVGSTGWSTGNHLHFEIHENGNPVDPMKFFN